MTRSSTIEAGRSSHPRAPLYQVMKRDVEQAIFTGRFAPGSRVPSESQLIAQYNVSSTTARRCLDELESEGLLYRVRGKGTFVSELAAVLQCRQIAVLVHDLFSLSHPFIAQVLGAIEKITEDSKVHLSVQRMPSLHRGKAAGRALLSSLRRYRTEFALILSNVPLAQIEPLLDAGIHCLGVNTRYQDDRVPHVALDFEAAAVKSLRSIVRFGHRRVAFLVQEPAMQSVGVLNSSSFLTSSWQTVREECPGLAAEPQVIQVPHPTEEHLPGLIVEMMNGPTPPTVIRCWDELVGLEVVRQLRRLGFKVPEEVSVIGSKLLPFSELAVIEAPLIEMAAASARAMLEWATQGQRPQNRLFAPGDVLPRETLAAPHHG